MNKQSRTRKESSSAPPVASNARRAEGHLLCLDDDAEVLALLQRRLSRHGFDVTCCSNSRQALQILQEQHIDLLIQDIVRPSEDGMMFYARLKASKAFSSLPVIFVSASPVTDEDALARIRTAGDSVLIKPVIPAQLIGIIENRLRFRSAVKRRPPQNA